MEGQGWVLSHSLFFFLLCFLSFLLSSPVSFLKCVEHEGYCDCFFVYYLLSMSLVPLSRSYWGIEIVVSAM